MGKRPRRGISQKQIAQDLGLSQSLVSMVLNGRRKGVSEDSFRRIWDYARDHGYTPKGMLVPHLAEGSPGTAPSVGYILRAPLRLATKSNFFGHIYQGLHDECSAHGWRVAFLGSEDLLDAAETSWRVESDASLKGIVILGQVQENFLRALVRCRKPVVYVAARSHGLCHAVVANDDQSAALLVEHFHGLGHRDFAWLGGNAGLDHQSLRARAVTDALRRLGDGATLRATATVAGGDRLEGHAAALQLLRSPTAERCTAWLCVNALVARGAITALLEAGLRPGRDVALGAFDRTRVCTDEIPGITGASADPEEMGREAARLVRGRADQPIGGPLMEVVLPALLTARETSSPIPAERFAVEAAKALPAGVPVPA